MPGGAPTAPLDRLRARYGTDLVPAHRPGAPLVVGARPHRQTQALRQAQGERCAAWQVLVFVPGLGEPIELTIAEARATAAQLLELADVLEGKTW